MAGRWSKRLTALSIAVGVSVAGLLALEAVLRRSGWHARTANFTLPGNHAAAFDDTGKFRRHPERYFSVGADYRRSADHAGRFATGAWPFRGRPAEPAPEGILRVAVFGDSCVYGEGVPVSATLPEQIQAFLARSGRSREAVQVLNFGVSGYSTVQIRLCLEEALERHRPDVVVLYPAAWNDQAPALGNSDLELLGQGMQPLLARLLPATSNALLHRFTDRAPRTFEDEKEEIAERMLEGRPRVEPEDVEDQVERMLAACAAESVETVVVLPAHRQAALVDFPRTGEDRETVRRVAGRRAVPIVDAPQILAETGADDVELFLDSVHPSPTGYEHIARAVATELLRLLPDEDPPVAGLRVARIEPAVLSALGDQRVTVFLEGWEGDEHPTILVGGAPLLNVQRTGSGRFEGTTMANGPGRQALLVQSAAGCATAAEPLVLLAPTLEQVPGEHELVVTARPADQVKVVWSHELRATPRWLPEGPQWVADGFIGLFPERVVCDAEGRVAFDPWDGSFGEGELFLQPVVDVLSSEGHVLASYVGDPLTWPGSSGGGR